MISLFQEFGTALSESYREIAIVIEAANQVFAVTADLVESVEEIRLEELPVKPSEAGRDFIEGVGRRKSGEDLLMVLSPERLSPASEAS